MTVGDSIAVRSIDLLKPSGERVAVRVELGPIFPAGLDSLCRVRFHGWIESPPDVRGRDSLEALLLAVGLVHGILGDFVRRGGRVLWAGTSNDCGLDEFVSSPEWQAIGPAGSLRASPSRRRTSRKPGPRRHR